MLGRVSVHISSFDVFRFFRHCFFRGYLFRGRTDDGTDFPRAFFFLLLFVSTWYVFLPSLILCASAHTRDFLDTFCSLMLPSGFVDQAQ
jgi:hypothetical protein